MEEIKHSDTNGAAEAVVDPENSIIPHITREYLPLFLLLSLDFECKFCAVNILRNAVMEKSNAVCMPIWVIFVHV